MFAPNPFRYTTSVPISAVPSFFNFGRTVTLSADGSVALCTSNGANAGVGDIRVFVTTDQWQTYTERPSILPPMGASISFGTQLALSSDGNTAVTITIEEQYVIETSDNWLTHTITLLDATGTLTQVAISGATGNLIAVGNSSFSAQEGQVKIFQRNAPAMWSLQATLSSPGSSDGAFGSSVVFSEDGSRLFTSAPNSPNPTGSIYYYNAGSEAGWNNSVVPKSITDSQTTFLGEIIVISSDAQTMFTTTVDSGFNILAFTTSNDWDTFNVSAPFSPQPGFLTNGITTDSLGVTLVIAYEDAIDPGVNPGYLEVFNSADRWATRILDQIINPANNPQLPSGFSPGNTFQISKNYTTMIVGDQLTGLAHVFLRNPYVPPVFTTAVDRGIVAGPPRDASFTNALVLSSTASGVPANDNHYSVLGITRNIDRSQGWVSGDKSWSNVTGTLLN